jgi:hypothetical protein
LKNKQQGTRHKAQDTRHKSQGTRRKAISRLAAALLFVGFAWLLIPSFTSCNIYRFNEASIPDSIKTVKIHTIENRAQYVNNQIAQRLTDKLRQKINGQTKLTQTSGDNPDWEINAYISQYNFSTSAISGQQVATNRLTVGVHVTLNDRKSDNVKEYDVSRSFEFRGTQSFQQAEATLMEEMTRTITDEIFNKLFSEW